MTDREIMQQALGALKKWHEWVHAQSTCDMNKAAQWAQLSQSGGDAIQSLEAALAQPELVQVRPHEFIAMASKQANMIGKPVVWAEYPTPHKIILDEGWEWGHEARTKEALAQPEQDEFAPYTGKGEASKIKHSLEPMPEQELVCDKDPSLCGFVQCQLGKVCKNTPINTMPTKIFAPNLEQILNAAGFYRREWVGLTNDEINDFSAGCHLGKSVQTAIYQAAAKLKEKNT